MRRIAFLVVLAVAMQCSAFKAGADAARANLCLTARSLGVDGRPCKACKTFWRAVESEAGGVTAVSRPAVAADDPKLWRDSRTGKVWRPIHSWGAGESARVDKLAPGDYRVSAALGQAVTPFGVSEVIHLDGSQEQQTTTVRLLAGPSLTVTARDARTSAPLDWFHVRLEREDGFPVAQGVWSRDGQVKFDQLPPGAFRLTAARTSTQYGWPEYAMAKGPTEIKVEAGSDQEVNVPLEEVKLSDEVVGQRWPFVVQGRVTDEHGQPLEGVTINASCGLGSLLPTGQARSGPDGRYTLRFRGGYSRKAGEHWRTGLQAATISAAKQGWSEANLGRQGGLYMADEMPTADNAWGARTNQVILPHQPHELNFVMRQAAIVRGQLLDERGRPLANHKLWINGDELPPSASVLAETKTDNDGRFRFEGVPTGYTWRFNIGGDLRVETRFEQSADCSVELRVVRGTPGGARRLELVAPSD